VDRVGYSYRLGFLDAKSLWDAQSPTLLTKTVTTVPYLRARCNTNSACTPSLCRRTFPISTSVTCAISPKALSTHQSLQAFFLALVNHFNHDSTRSRPHTMDNSSQPPSNSDVQAFLDSFDRVECIICWEPPGVEHELVTVPCCRHIFGIRCLRTWIESPCPGHNRCPHCRASLLGESRPCISVSEAMELLNSILPGLSELRLRSSRTSSTREPTVANNNNVRVARNAEQDTGQTSLSPAATPTTNPQVVGHQGNLNAGIFPTLQIGVNVGRGISPTSRGGASRGQFSTQSYQQSNYNPGPSIQGTAMNAGRGTNPAPRGGFGRGQNPPRLYYQSYSYMASPLSRTETYAGHGTTSAPRGDLGYSQSSSSISNLHQSSNNNDSLSSIGTARSTEHGMASAAGSGIGQSRSPNPTQPPHQNNIHNNLLPPQVAARNAEHGTTPTLPDVNQHSGSSTPGPRSPNLSDENAHQRPVQPSEYPTLQGPHTLIDYLSIPHGSRYGDAGIDPPPLRGVHGTWPFRYPMAMVPDPNDPRDVGLYNLAREVVEARTTRAREHVFLSTDRAIESLEGIRRALGGHLCVSERRQRGEI
jgi:hypothetical protein